MFKTILLIFLLTGYAAYSQHPDLEKVLLSNDLGYLVDNYVTSHNPTPHGWENLSSTHLRWADLHFHW